MNELKKTLYNNRHSPANHKKLDGKKKIQNLIKASKFDLYEKTSEFFNQSKDSNQFWHRYEKVLKTKKMLLNQCMMFPPKTIYLKMK